MMRGSSENLEGSASGRACRYRDERWKSCVPSPAFKSLLPLAVKWLPLVLRVPVLLVLVLRMVSSLLSLLLLLLVTILSVMMFRNKC